ncbi:MAG: hypothetical protein IPN90_10110 [Elusimicrobia bacterium]|nr:hypothetical protein [Elusimicrobiota bacterium]
MAINNPDFSLFTGGLLNRLFIALRLEKANTPRFGRRILFLVGLAMFPVIGICLVQGTAWGQAVKAPLFYDPGVLARFLFSLPLLILAEKGINRELDNAIGYFKSSGIIQEQDVALYNQRVARANRWANSLVAELVMFLLMFVSLWFRVDFDPGFVGGVTHWQWNPASQHASAAGVWFQDVSCSIYRFILMRWLWRIFIWTWFLWSVSRINLNLSATHPDKKGGLGILADTHAAFGMLALAASAQIAGVIGRSMVYEETTFESHKILIGSSIAVLVLAFILPLCVFNVHLFLCRRKGLRTYGTLAGRYTGLFERKWLLNQGALAPNLLGSSDIQSLADLGGGYEVVSKMGLFPLDVRLVSFMTLCAAAPFLPLAFFAYGANEILLRVMKLLV